MNHPTHFRKGEAKRETLITILIVSIGILGLFALQIQDAKLDGRKASRAAAVTKNLHQIFSAAQQYMSNKHVTSVTYSDLVGAGTNFQIQALYPVGGEDYTRLAITQTMTQLTISTADGVQYFWP